MKHHSEAEIEAKLRQARQLLARGQSQAQACKELGVSVMTYHRWRKHYLAKHRHAPIGTEADVITGGSASENRITNEKKIDEMRAENERLRRIVMDLLLEKVKAEEQMATIFRGSSFQRN